MSPFLSFSFTQSPFFFPPSSPFSSLSPSLFSFSFFRKSLDNALYILKIVTGTYLPILKITLYACKKNLLQQFVLSIHILKNVLQYRVKLYPNMPLMTKFHVSLTFTSLKSRIFVSYFDPNFAKIWHYDITVCSKIPLILVDWYAS